MLIVSLAIFYAWALSILGYFLITRWLDKLDFYLGLPYFFVTGSIMFLITYWLVCATAVIQQ